MQKKLTADEEADRMIELLDIATKAVRRGDAVTTALALAETMKTAQRLPQKVTKGESK